MKKFHSPKRRGTMNKAMNNTMNRRNNKRNKRSKSGSTLVEFALILPILLIISMLLVQYGIILNATLSLTHLAREGARFAAVYPYASPPKAADADIEDNIQSKLPGSISLADSTIAVFPTAIASRVPNSSIQVVITYNMKQKMFLPTKFFKVNVFGNGTYTTSSTMRIE